ncbi:MAG: hypothetical protein PVG83_13985 [Acidimicrobiia bacterium]|jgi:hypothetical protein
MDVIAWLLQSDPSIRWQVKADLTDEDPTDVGRERARVAAEGWGRALLDVQEPDGQWGGGFYSPKWVSTTYTLLQLRHYGIDPGADAVRQAITRLEEGGRTWRHGVSGGGGVPFFEYIGETCITAMNVALACYFGVAGSRTCDAVEFLLDQQMDDGGWNCEVVRGSTRSSFHTTISTLEALLEFERTRIEPSLGEGAAAARLRAHEFLLERRLMRSLSTGEIINPSWTRFSFPPRWWYDVLRGLEYLCLAAVEPDPRWDEAVELVERKRTAEGRWKLQNHHSGREHFRMEEPGQPSRWNTLRALRVLRQVHR